MSRQTRARELAAERKERTSKTSSKNTVPAFKRDGGSRARVRKPASATPAAAVGSGSVVNAFGTSYDMGDPAQVAAYEREQEAELDRQRSKSPMADIRGGDGIIGYENGELKRHSDPRTTKSDPAPRPALDRSNGTKTSPSGGGVMAPADLDAFVRRLSNTDPEKGIAYGIQFRTGFQSGALPGVKAGKGANIPEGADEEAIVDLVDQSSRYNVGNSNDAGTGYYKPTGSDPTDARNGISPVADAAEMKSSVPVGVDDRFADGADYGDDDQYVSPGFSARSRAFLDYDGPGNAAMALRAAEASQGYIRQNGRNFAITGTGEDGKRTFGEFDNEGRRALVKDGNSSISHSFMDTYGVTPKESTDSAVPTADEAQSPEIGYTTKLDMDPISKQHDAPDVNFGVGDMTFDQLEDYEGNMAKQTIEPVDWMNIYRGK